MSDLIDVIKRHPFTNQYNAEEVSQLAEICSYAEFQTGDYLLKEDEVCDRFYLLTSGLVSIELRMQGGEKLRLQTECAGAAVGWSWLFPPYRCQFDVRALETCKTIAVDASEMRELMAQDSLFAYRTTFAVLHTVAERLSQSRLQLLDIYSTTEPRA